MTAGPAPRTVVLTFDNLDEEAAAIVLPVLLDLLGRLGLTATFFVEGVNAEEHPNALLAIAAHGHQVGFHAWRHERWGGLDPAREAELIERGRAAFDALGLAVEAFRPPGGEAGAVRVVPAPP